jgi:hypothetical protein
MTSQKSSLRLKLSSITVLVLAGLASPLRAQQVQGRVTDLAPDVVDVPWSDAFQLGGGSTP